MKIKTSSNDLTSKSRTGKKPVMRSNRYCDALGNNCVATTGLGGGGKASNLTLQNGYAWVGTMLFQWGKACVPAVLTPVTFAYPTAFSNAALQITGSKDTPHPGATRANFAINLIDKNTFWASNNGSAGCTNYIAIGY